MSFKSCYPEYSAKEVVSIANLKNTFKCLRNTFSTTPNRRGPTPFRGEGEKYCPFSPEAPIIGLGWVNPSLIPRAHFYYHLSLFPTLKRTTVASPKYYCRLRMKMRAYPVQNDTFFTQRIIGLQFGWARKLVGLRHLTCFPKLKIMLFVVVRFV